MSADAGRPGLTSFAGWDVRGGSRADPGAADAFVGSASTDPGAGARYELLAVAARGFRPPRFLTVDDVADEGGPTKDPPDGDGFEGLRQTWSVRYRRITETGPRQVTAFAIYLLGVNPPPGLTDDELAVFNDFYTNVHLTEVAERRHALRAERYELVREVRAPYQGAPRFLAIYEVDEESASHRRHTGPPYEKGPEVWQRHKTPWRLWFHRLDGGGDGP